MNAQGIQDQEKVRKDRVKQAVALAMHNRWEAAAVVNEAILADFPRDLEAYNRLGKALSELGRNREAKEAFQRALAISPNNGIAKKNSDRLERLGDNVLKGGTGNSAPPDVFIEERGKAGLTSLLSLASAEILSKLAPGHPVKLAPTRKGLLVVAQTSTQVGQVEPRMASRLIRLMEGGNEYGATVISVGDAELTIIIREERKHPSQLGIVSFPLRDEAERRPYSSKTLLEYGLAGNDAQREDSRTVSVKDWSDDDTEPGDDDDYSPTFHRIIDSGDESTDEDTEI